MNRNLLIVIVTILVFIGGGTVYLLARQGDEPAQTNETTDQTVAEEPTAEQSSGNSGQYVDYSEEALASTEGTKILFFHASWCPQCRALEADIQRQGVPAGVTIFKVDYDTSQDLQQKYEVAIQTTLVKVDDNGDLIEKYVAYDEPSLSLVEENLL